MSSAQVFANRSSLGDPLNIESIAVDVEDVKPVVACRCCLVTDQPLRPLDHKLANAYALLISTSQQPDVYPKYMCTYCRALLLRFTSFREKCILVHTSLTNIHSAGTPITLDVINSDVERMLYPLKTTKIDVLSYKPPIQKQIDMQLQSIKTWLHEEAINDLKIKLSDSESDIHTDIEFEVTSNTVESINKIIDKNLPNNSDIIKINNENHRKNAKDNSFKSEKVRKKRDKTMVKSENIYSSDSDTPLYELANNELDSMENSDAGDYITETTRNDLKSTEFSLKDMKELNEDIKSNKKRKRQNCKKDVIQLIVPLKKKRGQKTDENVTVENTNETIETSLVTYVKDEKTESNKNESCVKPFKIRRRPRNKHYDKHSEEIKRQLYLEKQFDMKIVELTKAQQIQQMKDKKDSLSYQKAKFKCELCYDVFILRETYNNHMTKHQADEGKDVCQICVRTISRKKMKEHVRQHHKFNYICNQCGHISKILGTAKIHYRWHKGIKYDCKICGKYFDKPTSVLGHMHLSHKDVMVKCSICSHQCIGDKGLNSHMILSHKEAIGAVCPSCGVQFHSVSAMQRHRPHSDCDHTHRPCVACGLGFASDSLLRQHKIICESKKQYTCDFCSESFDSRIRYKNHAKAHTSYHRFFTTSYASKGATYMCEHCGKNCRTKQLFAAHTRSHTGEKPFVCDYCGKSFAAKPLLGVHINRHMEKLSMKARTMYECRYCGKQFSFYANKRRHEMTNHQGLVQFHCEMCGATFTTKKAMQDHVRHTHEGAPWPKRVRNRRQ